MEPEAFSASSSDSVLCALPRVMIHMWPALLQACSAGVANHGNQAGQDGLALGYNVIEKHFPWAVKGKRGV